MFSKALLFAALATLAAAISLPLLIPAIPRVTEPLATNAPPLLIFQVPTPPLDSPLFASNQQIKLKKIGHFWTRANTHKDFLATYSLDDNIFGTLLWITDVPSSGNSPHHLGPSLDGKTLVGGGLLSLLKSQMSPFFTENFLKFQKSNRALLSSITDEIRAKPDGGFFIIYMGCRLVETDANFNIIHEWPEDVSSTLNILGEQFSPHGLSIDFNKNIILTSDFIVPLTILKPASAIGIQKAGTLRLWELSSRKIISTITIPGGKGIQDVKFIPGNSESAALATTGGPDHASRSSSSTSAPARDNLAIYPDISDNGKFAYFTLTLGNHVAALEISDLNNVKRLDDPEEDQGIIGPHYVKILPDKKNLLVTDYFVQTGDIGALNTPADFKAQWIDILPDGGLSFDRSIDFQKTFSQSGKGVNRGSAKPHSAVIFDLTDPAHPKYY